MKVRPDLVERPGYGKWEVPTPVADFSDDQRPAFRVKCNCRNCHWQGEARFPVGTRIPQWVFCPKCEVGELSAHGDFLGRDEKTVAEEQAAYAEYLEKRKESERRAREVAARAAAARLRDEAERRNAKKHNVRWWGP